MKRLAIFVVMPFSDEFKDIYDLGIKAACTDAGADCERVDEQLFLENIPERVYAQIENADVIVAEMTRQNANVFYEVGYAHGCGKQVVLLTSKAADIPFDLRHYPHVVYDSIRKLKAELYKKILWCKENPEKLRFRNNARTIPKDELDALDEKITNYLTANSYTKMSLERIELLMQVPEGQVRRLIEQRPKRFRYALVKDKITKQSKPGIGFTSAS